MRESWRPQGGSMSLPSASYSVGKFAKVALAAGSPARPPPVRGPLLEAVLHIPADIYDKVSGELQKKGYDCECLGGGRISHQSQDKKIHVYGYSMGYGRAQHSVSTEKIKAKYPDYEVTWADDGY
uniref:14 kDa phosphohistidine phosphatase n=1 Tax=Spermophilus dauricus TaxID=99837 RepID=A0A8C9P264_SPEDA